MAVPIPFKVDVPQSKIDAILTRVHNYPWFPAPDDEGTTWGRGVNTAYLKELCAYWIHHYDWRAAEADLNRFPQFTSRIDGLDIHFLYVMGESVGRRPLLLSHGWPGSHFEFWGTIEKLAFPSRFGGRPEDAFDLVIPSLPGFGFSGKPSRPLGQRATARLFNTLMTQVLGHPRYIAQGGDWGGVVSSWLAHDHKACVGAHLNMIGFRPTPEAPLSDAEKAWLERTNFATRLEGAYFQQQATKPQTLAMSLMDSPVGTAAWILEKFNSWADVASKGSLEAVFTKDQLLTNIMIYLTTDSIASSVWYYRALFEEGGVALPEGVRCETPTGFANFPAEPVFVPPPRSWVERAYNIVRWTDMPRGGHFAAMEEPDLLIDDVRAFARDIAY
ncbi:MAG: epoxide hydrolase family protein [Caulobacterales bacterium]